MVRQTHIVLWSDPPRSPELSKHADLGKTLQFLRDLTRGAVVDATRRLGLMEFAVLLVGPKKYVKAQFPPKEQLAKGVRGIHSSLVFSD